MVERLALVLAVAEIVVVGTSATAQQTDEQRVEAHRLFEQAMDAFAVEDYPTALALFQRSYELNPRPITLLNIGMTQRALFAFPDAIDSFREYLRIEGSGVPADRREKLEAFLVEMVAAIVLLTVTVDEADASILVDGSEIGRSPLAEPIRLRAGSHIVEVRKEGFDDVRQRIETAPGDRPRLDFVLAAQAAPATTLRVVCDTPGASATVDGSVAGPLPLEVELPPGPHELRVEAPGFAVWTMTTQVIARQQNEVVVVLTPLEPSMPLRGEPGPPPEDGDSVASSWWFWTIIGAAVVGGAVTTTVLLWPEEGGAAVDRTWWVR